MMKKLLSLPPNLVECFHEVERASHEEWFCTSDPIGRKLGSGGGTAWLLDSCRRAESPDSDFPTWLAREKRVLLHAGGQSRRLPGYAPSGKILTPIPVFRWARGQKLDQNLLSIQIPLYEQIMEKAPASMHTLIASGDVYIRASQPLQDIPEADVVCYGLWVDANLAKNHGVFFLSREIPGRLDFMMQKPSPDEMAEKMQTHFSLMDIGVWLLSDRAVELLVKRSTRDGETTRYDLYSEFGLALGDHPQIADEEVNSLSVTILPLQGGEFYHYGTNRELISSTLAIQNLVQDQREIIHRKVKPHPAMFIQNAVTECRLSSENSEIWIENSVVGKGWTIHSQNIITGVPDNDWSFNLPARICVDVVPVGERSFVARPYGYYDAFRGNIEDEGTLYQGMPFSVWAERRKVCLSDIERGGDLQSARIFPICNSAEELGKVIRWMVSEPDLEEGRKLWMGCSRISADEISDIANLRRLTAQRERLRVGNWPVLARNHVHSVFYQLNLDHAAHAFAENDLPLPAPLPETTPLMKRISDSMFRARVLQLKGADYGAYEERAFRLMRDGLTAAALAKKQQPHMSIYSDQIVWGRSPVRIDLAGGWTDTPPYCLNEGGKVVNIAIELNGLPPLQVYVKPCLQYKVVLRSIDLGALEVVSTYEELADFIHVGSPFSIPKVALVLAGFHPGFSVESYASLEQQLQAFGCGLEITLLSAVPAGSGLGTSSILASTVLGAVSDFCGLGWDKNEICNRTLILEQLLTTGGGWQDQYGGVLHGVKLLETHGGMDQSPLVRWMPDFMFTGGEYRDCHLLYYTGVTRTAKEILAEIVRGMFLNSTERLATLAAMKGHAFDMYEAIQRGDFQTMGRLVAKTWQQNKVLDHGTNPPVIESIINRIEDYCLGLKLPGAGGGGFLYMVAKDPEAAARIRATLTASPPNARARFVGMSMSDKGLQVSRS